jgi:hypothetical protein
MQLDRRSRMAERRARQSARAPDNLEAMRSRINKTRRDMKLPLLRPRVDRYPGWLLRQTRARTVNHFEQMQR